MIHEEENTDYIVSGRILLRIDYEENKLVVQIMRGDNLAAAATLQKNSNPYIKMYLLQNNNKIQEWRTEVREKTLNPIFNETVKVISLGIKNIQMFSFSLCLCLFFFATSKIVIPVINNKLFILQSNNLK